MSSKGDGKTNNFSLRSWVYIDRMQPQYAAYAGSVIQGDVPIAGMAELYVEVAPSNEIDGSTFTTEVLCTTMYGEKVPSRVIG